MKTDTSKQIDLDDISSAIKTLTANIERFENPEDFMDSKDIEDGRQEDYKLKVACDLQFQLSVVKMAIGQRFDDLPAFSRMLDTVTKFIDKKTSVKDEDKTKVISIRK